MLPMVKEKCHISPLKSAKNCGLFLKTWNYRSAVALTNLILRLLKITSILYMKYYGIQSMSLNVVVHNDVSQMSSFYLFHKSRLSQLNFAKYYV